MTKTCSPVASKILTFVAAAAISICCLPAIASAEELALAEESAASTQLEVNGSPQADDALSNEDVELSTNSLARNISMFHAQEISLGGSVIGTIDKDAEGNWETYWYVFKTGFKRAQYDIKVESTTGRGVSFVVVGEDDSSLGFKGGHYYQFSDSHLRQSHYTTFSSSILSHSALNFGQRVFIHIGGDNNAERYDRFRISVKQRPDISLASMSGVSDQYYADSAVTLPIRLTYQGKVLREGYDYNVEYEGNNDTGEAKVIVTGINDWSGSISKEFTINERPSFPDVAKGSWYYNTVTRCTMMGFINGYSNGNFGPSDNITRGQVAVILWNMAGKPATGVSAKYFSDVSTGAYYGSAVSWASSVGVVNGYRNGKFGPDDNVTREQLAVMLSNYAKRLGGKAASGSASDYAAMQDAYRVSGYARSAVGWCFRNRLMSGANGRVLPQGNATRAEAAKMILGLHDFMN